MLKRNYKNKIVNIILIIIGIILIISGILFAIKAYNPKQKNYIKKSNIAYQIIQEKINNIYRKQKYLFDDKNDNICEILAKELSKEKANCINTSKDYSKNFKIDKTSIEIWGLEKAPLKYENTLIKDFFIDINGSKGENKIGTDRTPLRMYSTGRLGGILTPVNCSKDDEKYYGIKYSPICLNETQINFLANNLPFGFDILQIGGKNGKTKKINANIPFLRADCVAFGGELIAGNYCNSKGYYWNTACYYDYLCAVELSKIK